MYKRRDKGHPCRTPLDNQNGSKRKPLLEITESVLLPIFLMKLVKTSEYPSFSIILYKNFLSNLTYR